MKRIKVYIASPYTNADKLSMVRLQIDAWHILRDLGYIPIAPLLSHYINEVKERTHAEWIDYDFELIKMCNIVIRLKPKDSLGVEIASTGADAEEAEAKRLGLPFHAFNDLADLKLFFKNI